MNFTNRVKKLEGIRQFNNRDSELQKAITKVQSLSLEELRAKYDQMLSESPVSDPQLETLSSEELLWRYRALL